MVNEYPSHSASVTRVGFVHFAAEGGWLGVVGVGVGVVPDGAGVPSTAAGEGDVWAAGVGSAKVDGDSGLGEDVVAPQAPTTTATSSRPASCRIRRVRAPPHRRTARSIVVVEADSSEAAPDPCSHRPSSSVTSAKLREPSTDHITRSARSCYRNATCHAIVRSESGRPVGRRQDLKSTSARR